jgi:anti-sigma regulatory factor (Ser/Thr protein kinase)
MQVRRTVGGQGCRPQKRVPIGLVAVRFDSGSDLALEQSYPAVAASIPRAREGLVAFATDAGASGEQLEGIRLAVSEAVTNVVQHAYPGRSGAVHLSAAAISGELWILIADDGCGLEPKRDSPGLGLGLAWMAQFSDGLTLMSRVSGGLEVRLRFDLLDGAGENAAPVGQVRTA